jgi:hypothetical protein
MFVYLLLVAYYNNPNHPNNSKNAVNPSNPYNPNNHFTLYLFIYYWLYFIYFQLHSHFIFSKSLISLITLITFIILTTLIKGSYLGSLELVVENGRDPISRSLSVQLQAITVFSYITYHLNLAGRRYHSASHRGRAPGFLC